MTEYRKITSDRMLKIVDEESKKALEDVKQNSPVKKGKYKKGWTINKERSVTGTSNIISNRNYRLPHLLEKPHATRNGGRTRGNSHIAPAEEKAVNRIEERIRAEL